MEFSAQELVKSLDFQFGSMSPAFFNVGTLEKDEVHVGTKIPAADQFSILGNTIFCRSFVAMRNFMNTTKLGGYFRKRNGTENERAQRLRRATRLNIMYDPVLDVYECPQCRHRSNEPEGLGHNDCEKCFYLGETHIDDPRITHGGPLIVPVRSCEQDVPEQYNEVAKAVWVKKEPIKTGIAKREIKLEDRVLKKEKPFKLTAPHNYVEGNVQSIMDEVLAVALEANIPVYDLDNIGGLNMLRLRHVYQDIKSSGVDDLEARDRVLATHPNFNTVLCSRYDIKYEMVRPGWSGVIIHKRQVAPFEQDLFHWVNDVCIVQGKNVITGRIENALDKKTARQLADITLFSAASHFRVAHAWCDQQQHLEADHAYVDDLEFKMAWTISFLILGLVPKSHVGCRVCTDNVLEMGVDELQEKLIQAAIKMKTLGFSIPKILVTLGLVAVGDEGLVTPNIRPRIDLDIPAFNSTCTSPLIDAITGVSYIVENLRVLQEMIVKLQGVVQAGPSQVDRQTMSNRLAEIKDRQEVAIPKIRQIVAELSQDAPPTIASHFSRNFFLDSKSDTNGDFNVLGKYKNIRELLPEILAEATGTTQNASIKSGTGLVKANRALITPSTLMDLRSRVQGSEIKQMETECILSGSKGQILAMCDRSKGRVVSYGPIGATKQQVRVSKISISKQVAFPTFVDRKVWEFREGYCYAAQLAILLGFVSDEEQEIMGSSIRAAVAQLGAWPTMEAYFLKLCDLTQKFPTTREAPAVVHLVSHEHKIVHVVGQFGTANSNWHHLDIPNVGAIVDWCIAGAQGGILAYKVGGIKWMVDKEKFLETFYHEPEKIAEICTTPSTLWLFAQMSTKHAFVEYLLLRESSLASIFIKLEYLGKHLHLEQNVDDVCVEYAIGMRSIMDEFSGTGVFSSSETRRIVDAFIDDKEDYSKMELIDRIIEKNNGLYGRELTSRALIRAYWADLFSRRERFFLKLNLERYSVKRLWLAREEANSPKPSTLSYEHLVVAKDMLTSKVMDITQGLGNCCCSAYDWCVIGIIRQVRDSIIRSYSWTWRTLVVKLVEGVCLAIVVKFILEIIPHLKKMLKHEKKRYNALMDSDYIEQHGKMEEHFIFKFCAIFTLVVGIFHYDWGIAASNVMSRLKGVFAVLGDFYIEQHGVQEDLQDAFRFVEFEVDQPTTSTPVVEQTFGGWIRHCIDSNQVMPCPTMSGRLVEFFGTEESKREVSKDIGSSRETDFRVYGGVGCGKSTKLPMELSKQGHVLLCVPTRVLAESLRNSFMEVFHVDVNLRYRQRTHTGSAPITIMTYGFAYQFLRNNVRELTKYLFILFDEVHTNPRDLVPLYSWIRTIDQGKKVLKLSATHAGVDKGLTTPFPVTPKTIKKLSIIDWAKLQGTQVAEDATSYGDNILVFVASYKDVDTCATQLREGGMKVLKVDGRTFRNNTNIQEQLDNLGGGKKFIVATNIIENGVTLNVDVVVDFGEKIVADLDGDNRSIVCKRQRISRPERIQRMGRVGRTHAGVVFKLGNDALQEAFPNELTATESALICFAEGLKPVVDNVNTTAVGDLLRSQVQIAQSFELNQILIANCVTKEGKMPRCYHKLFKDLILNSETIPLCEQFPRTMMDGWRPLREYIRIDDTNRHVQGTLIPWYTSDISEQMTVKLAEATLSGVSQVNGRFKVPAACFDTLATKISVNKNSVGGAKFLVSEALNSMQQWRDNMMYAGITTSNNTLMNFCCSSWNARATSVRNKLEQNVQRLQCLHDQLGVVEATSDYDKLEAFFAENPESAAYLESHSKSDFLDEVVLDAPRVSKLKVAVSVIGLGIALTSSLIWWMKRRREAEILIESHGKNKRIHLNRDKRAEAFVFQGPDNAFVEEYGVDYSEDVMSKRMTRDEKTRRMKAAGRPIGSDPRSKRKFKMLYGLDPNEFDGVTLEAAGGAFSYTAPTKDFTLQELMQDLADEYGIFKESMPKDVNLFFTRDGESTATKVRLTPHDPKRAGMTSDMPAGFPSHRGEFRQTGEPELVKRPTAIKEVIESHILKPEIHLADQHLATRLCVCYVDSFRTSGFIHGRKLVVPFHLNKFGGLKLEVSTVRGVFNLGAVSKLACRQVPDRDCMIIDIPPDMPSFRSSEVFRKPIREESVYTLFARPSANGVTSSKGPVSIAFDAGTRFGGLWTHDSGSELGDCGCFIVGTKDGKVVGFNAGIARQHTTGRKITCVFIPVDDAILEGLKGNVGSATVWNFDPNLVEWNRVIPSQHDFPVTHTPRVIESHMGESEEYFGGNLIQVGEMDRNTHGGHVIKGKRNTFTQYCIENPTCCFVKDDLLSHYAPSILNGMVFYKDLIKFDEPILVGQVDEQCIEEAFVTVVELLEYLDFKGNCGSQWSPVCLLESLNKKASMGAMYTGTKGMWLDTLTPREFIRLMASSFQNLNNGKVGLWSGSLKAELRHVDKIAQNKTRVFTGAPIDVLLGGKILVDNFNEWFYSKNLEGPWTVGINKFSRGWDRFAKKCRHDWVFIDCDGSRFDSSLSPLLFQLVCNIRELFGNFEPDEVLALRNLYAQIVYTPILTIDGYIVKKFRGNNSGQPSTVVDNTLILMLVVEYARACFEKKRGVRAEMEYFCNGDDLLINCPKEVAEVVKEDFSGIFKSCGLNYDFSHVCESILDVEYMSHKFVWSEADKMFLPKLSKERITAILEWERSDELFRTRSALNAAYVESYGYPDLLDEIENYANEWGRMMGIEKVLVPRECVRELYTSSEFEVGQEWLEALLPPAFEGQCFIESHMESSETAESLQRELEEVRADPNMSEMQKQATINALEVRLRTIQDEVRNPQATPSPPRPGGSSSSDAPARGRRPTHGGQVTPRPQHDVSPETAANFDPVRLQLNKTFWVPRAQVPFATPEFVQRALMYTPRSESIDTSYASQDEVATWAENVTKAYGITPEQFWNDIFIAWIVNCIVNGTSSERQSETSWRAVAITNGNDGETVEYPMKPMYEFAKPTMRAVMRHFGEQAKSLYMNSVKVGRPLTVKTALGAGYADVQSAWLGIDFIKETSGITTTMLDTRHQILAANVRKKSNMRFALALPGSNTETDNERHEVGDVRRGIHTLQGAALE